MNNPSSIPPSERRSSPSPFLARLELGQHEADVLPATAPPAAESGSRLGPCADEPLEARPAPETRRELRSLRAYLETFLITVSFPALGFALDRSDPFVLGHPFSWLALAPVLIALRHGFALGFSSAMALDTALTLSWRLRVQRGEAGTFPGEVLVGMVALAMIAGQFSDISRRDIARFRRGLQMAARRLEALQRAHFLVQLSHDRLVQQQGPAAANLRDAITDVRKLKGEMGARSLRECAPAIIELYASYLSVEVATLHEVERGALVQPPLALLGKPQPVDPGDPLLVDALASRTLTHMPGALARGAAPHASRLLAAIPFVDTGGVVRGALTVESMPFIAFEKRTLEAMVVLGGHVADLLAHDERAGAGPAGPADLQLVVDRALADLRLFKMPATLAALRVTVGGRANDVLDVILGAALREIDFPLALRDPRSGELIVYILLPMSDESVALTVFDRMGRMMQREAGMSLAAAGVRLACHALTAEDTAESAILAVDARTGHAKDIATPVAS